VLMVYACRATDMQDIGCNRTIDVLIDGAKIGAVSDAMRPVDEMPRRMPSPLMGEGQGGGSERLLVAHWYLMIEHKPIFLGRVSEPPAEAVGLFARNAAHCAPPPSGS